MPYVRSDGTVTETKSLSRSLTDFFWTIINVIGLLFSTFFNPTKPVPKRMDSSSSGASAYKTGSGGGTTGGAPKGGNIRGMDMLRAKGGACATGGG